jgi:hypothetical protein
MDENDMVRLPLSDKAQQLALKHSIDTITHLLLEAKILAAAEDIPFVSDRHIKTAIKSLRSRASDRFKGPRQIVGAAILGAAARGLASEFANPTVPGSNSTPPSMAADYTMVHIVLIVIAFVLVYWRAPR